MENLNAEQIIKALECCGAVDADISTCDRCPFEPKEEGKGSLGCNDELIRNALSLIKELTEENERLKNICESYMLQYGTATDKEAFLKGERADTVRKMHSLIKERCIAGGIYPAFVASTIEKVAKELLRGD